MGWEWSLVKKRLARSRQAAKNEEEKESGRGWLKPGRGSQNERMNSPGEDDEAPDHLARYSRQVRFPPIGKEGQQKLLAARVLVVGCGALGSAQASLLARAGVGKLRIVDRDFLELSNLQRQTLYDEDDVASGLPKAIAARNRLVKINSQIEVEAHVADVDAGNIAGLLAGVDCLLDGTDNFETRYLLNDASLKLGIPWVYGGCLGAEGQTLTILPGETPCLRCLLPEAPPPGSSPTCDAAGILGTIIQFVAAWQCNEALKILCGRKADISRTWNVFDLWDATARQIKLGGIDRSACPACSGKEFPWLEGRRGGSSAVLCGRNAVQLSFPDRPAVSLANLERQLASIAQVSRNPYLLRATIGPHTLTVFPDGRAVIGGTEDIAEARSLYARYIGN